MALEPRINVSPSSSSMAEFSSSVSIQNKHFTYQSIQDTEYVYQEQVLNDLLNESALNRLFAPQLAL